MQILTISGIILTDGVEVQTDKGFVINFKVRVYNKKNSAWTIYRCSAWSDRFSTLLSRLKKNTQVVAVGKLDPEIRENRLCMNLLVDSLSLLGIRGDDGFTVDEANMGDADV